MVNFEFPFSLYFARPGRQCERERERASTFRESVKFIFQKSVKVKLLLARGWRRKMENT